MSEWKKYKENMKAGANPFSLLNPNNYIEDNIAEKRLEICRGCEEFIHKTERCQQCGCFMKAKTKLKAATCPIHKW